MRTIYKYKLKTTDEQFINMPIGAEYLSVGKEPCGTLVLWAAVDTEAHVLRKLFAVVGTGNHCPYPLSMYIGTVREGPFVWHIFGEKA